MKKSEELTRFENELKNNAELAKKFDQAARDAIDSGDCKCDGDVLSKAAKSLGYDIAPAEFERANAEMESLDPEELKQVSGGGSGWCFTSYLCALVYHQKDEDEHGHNTICAAIWHCFTAMMHTDTKSHDASCWKDFQCLLIYLDYWGNPITDEETQ